MSGKKSMGRTSGVDPGAAAVQPSPAVQSAPHERPRPQPCSHQIANSRSAASASTRTIDRVTRAQLTERLQGVILSARNALSGESDLLLARRFVSDVTAMAAAAERGDTNA